MIKLDNDQWCYSPVPISDYNRAWLRGQSVDDLPTWNMMYLTYRDTLEGCLDGRISKTESIKLMPAEEVGRIQAAVDTDLKQLEVDRGLRDLATKPLPLFIHQFPNLDLRIDPAIKLFDGKWVERVLANAKKIYEAHCEKADEVSVIDPALSNVIIGKFRR